MKIAIDAMGGDNAPEVVVEGAVLAAREYNVEIFLVGIEQAIRQELNKYEINGLKLDIVSAADVVGMDEPPLVALRQKKDSSLSRAAQLVKRGEAQAMLSAGNTGAAMACAKFTLKSIKGVERPAIATLLPSLKGCSLLLDVGANVDCKPFHLLQFAIMGQVYAHDVMGIAEPKVGLLNIGHEPGKGNELTKQAFELLDQAPINFIGNVEGKHIYNGETDVIVCDGFIGNVGLKISEAVADTITVLFKRQVKKSLRNKLGALLLKNALLEMKQRIDYSEYGGAPLLGLNGVCIICHGKSSAKAIKNAIRVAAESVEHNVNEHIAAKIIQRSKVAQLWGNISKRKP
jgi:glycerol-3-phosphate acyltransferase PlsX